MAGEYKILVVDDEKDLLETVRFRLSHSGYSVVTAEDGAEALEKARTEKPDLIMLDLMLPKLDGYKVCSILKKDSQYSGIPVIIFSARAQEEDIRLAKETGADEYVTKPFEPQELLGKIRDLLSKRVKGE